MGSSLLPRFEIGSSLVPHADTSLLPSLSSGQGGMGPPAVLGWWLLSRSPTTSHEKQLSHQGRPSLTFVHGLEPSRVLLASAGTPWPPSRSIMIICVCPP